MNRNQIIDFLVTNCDCWKQSGDREVLNGFSDEKLKTLKAAADREAKAIAVANAAANGIEHDGRAYRVNPETGEWEGKVTSNSPPAPAYGQPPYREEEEEYEDEEDRMNRGRMRGEPSVANRRRGGGADRPKTREQIINSLPREMQEQLRVAAQIEEREKEKIIGQILANSAVANDSDRAAHYERLIGRSIEELHATLSLIPKAPTQEESERAVANGSSHTRGRSRRGADGDMLVPQVIDWNRDTNSDDAATANSGSATGEWSDSDGDDDPPYEEVMARLPGKYKAMLQNAAEVDARERRRLIDELTANLDEQQERRMRRRLQNRPVDELRDMVSLLPKSEPKHRNYFGQSAAVANSGGGAATSSAADADLLPLPTMNFADDGGDNDDRRGRRAQ